MVRKMGKTLEQVVNDLGNGCILRLTTGELLFQLDSHARNPLVTPRELNLIWQENGMSRTGAVFNGGAALFQNQVILTPRCHQNYREIEVFDSRRGATRRGFDNYTSEIWVLTSKDGLEFKCVSGTIIKGDGTNHQDFLFGIEDVRIIEYKQKYLLVGCGKIKPPFKGRNADRVAIYSTKDFKNITYHGIIENLDSRNAVPLFLDNEAFIFLRFYPHIYLCPLKDGVDQLLNPAEYISAWKRINKEKDKHLLLEADKYPHEKEKIGPGPPPIRTDEGWLVIYHAVGEIDQKICKEYGLARSIHRGYSVCAALLDLENPRKVLCRTKKPIYIPSKPYELEGDSRYPVDIPAVVFPTGAIVKHNKLLLYCGAGDKYMILLSCNLTSLLDYMLECDQTTKRE